MLSKLSKKVLTLEIVPELAEKAENKIKELGIKNIKVKQEDFRKLKDVRFSAEAIGKSPFSTLRKEREENKGFPRFDKIIFTAGISHEQIEIIENFAKNHLKEKGILLCPHKSGPLIIMKNKKGKIEKVYTEENYVFVPLILR